MAKGKLPKVRDANSSVEFKLLIEHFNDPLTKRSGIVFLFRTSEEFRNFVYELVIENKKEDSRILFNIVGLKTPMTDFPRPGPALCRCEMEDLKPGKYTVIVDRRGKQLNQFLISINKRIKVLRSTRQGKFIEVTTDRSQWSRTGD